MSHKLLLADDSVTIQRVIELTFADEDVQVLTAGDGEQAIARIQSERPDIVLADVGMPKRSGYDVSAFVKAAPDLSHIPVLLLTGAFEPVDERRAQASGCDGVLVKPFEPQHVIARVRELLDNVTARGRGRSSGSVTRAVSDVPRPVERLTPHRTQPQPMRPAAAAGPGEDYARPAQENYARPEQESVGQGTDLDDYFDRLDAAFAGIVMPADAQAAHGPEGASRREGPVMERDLDWFDSPSQAPPQPVSMRQEAPPAPPSKGSVIDVQWSSAPSHTAPSHTVPANTVPANAVPANTVPANTAPSNTAPSHTVPAYTSPQPPSIEPPDSPAVRAPEPAQPVQPAQASYVPPAGASGSGSLIADAFSALLAAEQGDLSVPPVRLQIGGGPAVTEELVDEIVRRVVERLGSHAVHGLVEDVVSRVAERLVREEIGRIRGQRT